MSKNKYYFTREGFKKAKLDISETVFGNAKEEQDALKFKVDNATLIENSDEYVNWDGLTVIMKSIVEVDYDGENETYTILGCNESDIMSNKISYYSPLAQVLLGRKVGDIVSFKGLEIVIKKVTRLEDMIYEQQDLETLNANDQKQALLNLKNELFPQEETTVNNGFQKVQKM